MDPRLCKYVAGHAIAEGKELMHIWIFQTLKDLCGKQNRLESRKLRFGERKIKGIIFLWKPRTHSGINGSLKGNFKLFLWEDTESYFYIFRGEMCFLVRT